MLPPLRASSLRQTCPVSHAIVIVAFMTAMAGLIDPVVAEDATPRPAQQASRDHKPHVGSAMALLATLEQAHVLPPENTPEANQIIKSVIQFQSAFAKSDDRSVQDFVARALAMKYGEQAADRMAEFRSSGWTAGLLEALADAELEATAEDRQALATGLSRFNLSTNDFHRFMNLVRDARQALEKRGSTFEQVYASHRRTMPGANAMR